MKFTTLLSSAIVIASSVLAAPVDPTQANGDENIRIPEEAIIGYLDMDGAHDVGLLSFSNETASGLMFVNTTILNQALNEENADKDVTADATTLAKREANPEAHWHWLQLGPFQPLYKREANPEAHWHWLELGPFQPLYKREANPEAEAHWHWLELGPFQPLY